MGKNLSLSVAFTKALILHSNSLGLKKMLNTFPKQKTISFVLENRIVLNICFDEPLTYFKQDKLEKIKGLVQSDENLTI